MKIVREKSEKMGMVRWLLRIKLSMSDDNIVLFGVDGVCIREACAFNTAI